MARKIDYQRIENQQDRLERMVIGGQRPDQEKSGSKKDEHVFDPEAFANLLLKKEIVTPPIIRRGKEKASLPEADGLNFADYLTARDETCDSVFGFESQKSRSIFLTSTKSGRGGSSRRSRYKDKLNMRSLVG